MNKRKNLKLLRDLIREELGRDFKTTMDSMLDWKNLPGVHAEVTVDPRNNRYRVQIMDLDSNGSTIRYFGSEEEANFYARKTCFDLYRKKVENPNQK